MTMSKKSSESHKHILDESVGNWNLWRQNYRHIRPNLNGSDFTGLDLSKVNLSGMTLEDIYFVETDLSNADLSESAMRSVNFQRSKLINAKFCKSEIHASSKGARIWLDSGKAIAYELFNGANFREADLTNADLSNAYLQGVDFTNANLSGASLLHTNLIGANLTNTNLSGAKLIEADLSYAILYATNFQNATIARCRIHGISAWKLNLDKAQQIDLIITGKSEPEISVDNIEVAQFIYLLLHNRKIRDVINTVANKAVLILGRFTPERKKVLDRIKDYLRSRNYVPILFDFEKPTNRDSTETILTLASLSKFIIADLSDPRSTPLESQIIIPNLMIPFVPIIAQDDSVFSMFQDLKTKYHWVLDAVSYETEDHLISLFENGLLEKAESKFAEIRDRK